MSLLLQEGERQQVELSVSPIQRARRKSLSISPIPRARRKSLLVSPIPRARRKVSRLVLNREPGRKP